MLSAGLGSVFIGRLTDRLNTRKTIVMFYLIGAVAIFYLSFNYHIALTYVLVALAGMGITGVGMVQVGYITHYYPTKIRASATGWAIGVGRIGAIMGRSSQAIFWRMERVPVLISTCSLQLH